MAPKTETYEYCTISDQVRLFWFLINMLWLGCVPDLFYNKKVRAYKVSERAMRVRTNLINDINLIKNSRFLFSRMVLNI